ncbi:MAG TPA: septal ring lytic transglycosylase RlpA family protein [Beijerinckiaceae bacterium]|nr:septal ring lytic transglycosylase RlpA family protein [Beijerinckiaceae bacterium]
MPTGQPGSPAAETPSRAPLRLPPAVKIAAVVATALTAANCSAPRVASNGRTIDPKYGVVASPRVVEDGEPVPKGGGRELVGRPYQIAGKTYVPRENISGYSRTGLASWYGAAFHGRLTANGEVFDRHSIAAAHTTMPLPSYARVTNLENRRSVIVRVNDRGPYHANRIMDVSEGVAEALEFKRMGTARVQVDYVGRASTRGSDDRKLLATLRTDGSPAPFPGGSRSMFAALEDQPAATPARPQAFAFLGAQRYEEPEAPALRAPAEPAYSPRPSRSEVAALAPEPESRVAHGVPLPPERPFDLGTIPNAGVPVPVAALAPIPPSRPVFAGLYYAPPQPPRGRFAKSDPFQDLKPQRFVALKAVKR